MGGVYTLVCLCDDAESKLTLSLSQINQFWSTSIADAVIQLAGLIFLRESEEFFLHTVPILIFL